MKSTQHGFTLIEIIIVVLVFSIMAAMAYGGLNSVLRTRQGIETALDRTAAMQRAYFRLRNDFQNLRNRPVRDAFGDIQPAMGTDREGRVTLTRGGWRNPLLQPRASLERVSYRLEDHQLVRSSWRVLDQAQDSKPVDLVVMDRVDELKWRFLGTENEWSENWPTGNRSPEEALEVPPPRAVELTLVTADWGELRFLFKSGALSETIDFDALSAGGGSVTDPPPDSGQDGSTVPEPSDPQEPAAPVDPPADGADNDAS